MAEAMKAESSDGNKACKPCCVGKKMFKPQDLPAYGCPECPSKFEVVESPASQLEAAVKEVRLAVTPGLVAVKEVVDRGMQMVDTAVTHSKQSWEYVSSEGNTTTRGIAIVSGGLAGIILARRGFFRKLVLGSTGAGIVAANMYPEEYKRYKSEYTDVLYATVKTATGYDLEKAMEDVELPKLSSYMPADLSFSALFGGSDVKSDETKKA